ncbi:MAG TPA: 3-dehydroquinate synthase [Trueperaceae bacterium]
MSGRATGDADAVSAGRRRTVTVALSPPYDVVVGPGLLGEVATRVAEATVAVVSDDAVWALHGRRLAERLEAGGKRVAAVTFPPGEASKDLATLGRVLRALASAGLGRDGAVLALGGGVVGDLGGLAAATYLRGVALYQLPTSLLAMVDAAIGGKTGIDLPEGKNLVGAFWQPRAVLADVQTLATLSPRELRQGTAEVVKTGLIGDPGLVDEAERLLVPAAAGEGAAAVPPDELAEVVARAAAVKARVVAADPHEAGVRAHLNLGHTLAHALEAASGLALGHGDAVLYGLVYAAALGRARGLTDQVERLAGIVERLRPDPLPDLPFEALVPYMRRDKKARAGRLRFVLLAEPGRPVVVDDVGEDELRSAWRALEELVR